MGMQTIAVPDLLDRMEAHYGAQEPGFPVDPWEFLIWWHCGYPQSDARCHAGWESLKKCVSIQPRSILAASQAQLAAALKAGGMVPELRAMRLHEIAQRVVEEYGGDLSTLFAGPIAKVRAALKRFPGIANPGADRMLLFRPRRAGCRRALQLRARPGPNRAWPGAGKLRRHLPRVAGTHRAGSSGAVSCAPARLPAAESPWPNRLQDEAEMRPLPVAPGLRVRCRRGPRRHASGRIINAWR